MKKVFTSILSSVNVGIAACLVALMATSCSYKSANISSSLKSQDIEWKSKDAVTSTVVENNNTSAPKTISATEFKTTIKEEIVKSNPGVTLSPKQEKQLDKLSNVLAKKYNKLSPEKKAEINNKAETLKKSSGGLKQGVILAVIGLLVMSLAYYVPVIGWLIAIVGAVLLIYGVYLILMDIL
ncbi:MAG: hypothetical protein RLZZ175_997 [Bacteroidota bacterium]|jgi:hypothetical protein